MHKSIEDRQLTCYDIKFQRHHKIEFWGILLGVIALIGVVFTVFFVSWIWNLFAESLQLF